MTGREVSDIVEQRRESGEAPLRPRKVLAKRGVAGWQRTGTGLSMVGIDRVDHFLCDVQRAKRVLKATVCSATEHQVGLAKLVHCSESLQSRVVDDFDFPICKPDESMHG